MYIVIVVQDHHFHNNSHCELHTGALWTQVKRLSRLVVERDTLDPQDRILSGRASGPAHVAARPRVPEEGRGLVWHVGRQGRDDLAVEEVLDRVRAPYEGVLCVIECS